MSKLFMRIGNDKLPKFIDRFIGNIRKTDSGCLVWSRSKDKDGYGYLSLKRDGRHHPLKAHRVAYELFIGTIPEGLCVMHSCDNPPCCNPAHLSVGTHHENYLDKMRKNRQVKGSKHGQSKMTEDSVREMRHLFSSGAANQMQLAKQFGIAQPVVSRIIHRKIWTHV